MPQTPETEDVFDLLRRIIAHARTVTGDVLIADRVVKNALARNPRRPGSHDNRNFVLGVLRSISLAVHVSPMPAIIRSCDAIEGALAGLETRDREALSLRNLFGLSPLDISQVMAEPAELSEMRLKRASDTVGTALVPHAVAPSPSSGPVI